MSKVVKGVNDGYELSYLNAKNQTLIFCKGDVGICKNHHSNHQLIALAQIIIKGKKSHGGDIFSYLLFTDELWGYINQHFSSSVSYV